MYLRTTKRKNKDGSVVEYYQLAHNERHPTTRKPVAKVIHSFGRTDQLDRAELVRLCRSIARVCGLTVLDPVDAKQDDAMSEPWGLPRNLKLVRTTSYGCVLAIEELWKRVGLKKIFETIIRKDKLSPAYERALFAMVANRLCEPESKLGVWDRWLEKVYLPDCSQLKLKQMYRAMDLLHAHSETVEKAVFNHTADLFNLAVDVIFYDTTTASFSIDRENDEPGGENLRKFGHSKEGTWTPQVVVALAVTREGIPVRSWVFPGNTSDFQTIETVRKDLRGWKLGRAMFVADSGMNSLDNRKELARWAPRRIEAHVKICVLALLIERVAELSCGKPWHKIRRDLDKLQVSEFFNLKFRFLARNEISPDTRNTLNLLKIKPPKQIIHLEKRS